MQPPPEEPMKRFTETDKWRDRWFRLLPADLKLAYLYIVDNCDSAGVWEADYELAEFAMGAKPNWQDLIAQLGERLTVLESGKWWLTRFIGFQYGPLSDDCKPHQNVLRVLKAHGLTVPLAKVERVPQASDGDAASKKETRATAAATALEIYALYPRKVAKTAALKAIATALTRTSAESLLAATKGFADAVAKWPEHERKYIPHPATWFNQGRYEDDPATWTRDNSKQPNANHRPNSRHFANADGGRTNLF